VTNPASRTFKTISGQFVTTPNETKSDQAIKAGIVRFAHGNGIAGRKVRVSQQEGGSWFPSTRLHICRIGGVRGSGIRSRYLRLRDEDGTKTENHHYYAEPRGGSSHRAPFRNENYPPGSCGLSRIIELPAPSLCRSGLLVKMAMLRQQCRWRMISACPSQKSFPRSEPCQRGSCYLHLQCSPCH
jgi:hypothetical protein